VSAPTLVLGVDSSTQSTKVEARRIDDGAVVAHGHAPHPPTSPPVSEQDPVAWWDALRVAIEQLGDHRDDVVAMAVAGQQHGLVLIDADGWPVRAAKLWNDSTSAPEAQALVDRLGAARWAAATGTVPVASITVTKLAWIAAHEPAALERTTRVMLPHDYLTWCLTGEHVTDRGDASGTGWYDALGDRYVGELLDAAGVDAPTWLDRLPRVLGPAEAVGTLTGEAAATLGLSADVVVGPGTGDNMGAALGLGIGPGEPVLSLGTSGTAYLVSERRAVAGFASASGDFLPLVCTLNATKVTDTVSRWLGAGLDEFAAAALAAGDDPGETILVPYFDGERTPNLPDATGSLHGLTNATTREQLALAAHDGVLCGLLDGLDALTAVGASTGGRRFLVGGGARSRAYRQRLADLSGSAVVVPDADETVAAGAAVQAAMVSGRRRDEIADRWMLGTGETIEPGRDATARRSTYAAAIVSNG
jgi:xylulokinase